MKHFFALVLLCCVQILFAQNTGRQLQSGNNNISRQGASANDTVKGKSTVWKNPNKIQDYKIFTVDNDTTFVDTTLSVNKNYKFNYLRKDNFELLPFANIGQTYNRLSLDTETNYFPQMGQTAKYYNYMEADDIRYYSMPTPLTEWFFKTTLEQGQLLDASISFNTSKQLNFYIAYKGLSSLGKYINVRSSTGNFRFSSNYHSKNDRYDLKLHFVGQDINNQENVGILNNEYFTSGEEDFKDRSRLEVIMDDAENKVVGKRYFLRQEYYLVHQKDSTSYNTLSVGHSFNYETKRYYYDQDNANDYFGDAYLSSGLSDRMKLRAMNNQVFATFNNYLLGKIGFKAINYNYNYSYKSVTNVNGITVPAILKGNETAVEASYKKQVGGFMLNGSARTTLIGDLGGTNIFAEAGYKFNDKNSFHASVTLNSRMPNFNYLMYQSDYINYNWYNADTFEKQQTKTLNASLKLNKILNVDVTYSILNKYTYFSEVSDPADTLLSIVAPTQYGNTINYLKLKAQREFRVGKFALDNTVMYQNVGQDNPILNVPQLVTRNTLYFSTPMFRKNLFVQTGITFNYFTKYYANKYNPLLAEFSVQNKTEIGEYPLFDFFLNFKIRQTRFFFNLDHVNTLFSSDYNYYSAPNNPYRDFSFRFGLVWDLFS